MRDPNISFVLGKNETDYILTADLAASFERLEMRALTLFASESTRDSPIELTMHPSILMTFELNVTSSHEYAR